MLLKTQVEQVYQSVHIHAGMSSLAYIRVSNRKISVATQHEQALRDPNISKPGSQADEGTLYPEI